MLKEYLRNLKSLWTEPSLFFGEASVEPSFAGAFRFAIATGILVALELGFVEALSGAPLGITAFVLALMLAGMPLLVFVWVYAWAGFVRLCGLLLGESLPSETLRIVTAYSTVGWIAAGVGFGLGKWLALSSMVFQLLGLEKFLKCSRWTAAVYVGLPFSLLAVFAALLMFMFKVFK